MKYFADGVHISRSDTATDNISQNRFLTMKKLFLLVGILQVNSCVFFSPRIAGRHDGPYIDSIGFAAAQARIEMVEEEASGTLISEALAVQDDSRPSAQASFFSSIEESYQRYLPLFAPIRRSERPAVRCRYDLVATFTFRQIDPLPFINALLHRMALTDLTTADFKVEPVDNDTLLLYITCTVLHNQMETGKMSVTESDLIVSVDLHRATLMTAIPWKP